MSIQPIAPIAFQADKKFRLPVHISTYDRSGTFLKARIQKSIHSFLTKELP